jgi:UDP-N-acetylmuramoyl-L-alanyl-D-glutamate--2,6-diaminopimelate ligase
MRLAELIEGTGATLVAGRDDVVISDITSDSRSVKAGMLFAAMPGATVDGAAFIPAAVRQGAVAVLCGPRSVVPEGLARTRTGGPDQPTAVLRADEPRLALAKMAANFYPRQPKTIVAVTGTNGKTSIAEFTRQIFSALGYTAASLGTIGVVKGDGAVYGSLTTPDPITLHKTLQTLADDGVTHLALEASSHGLDQFRLDGVRLSAGAFNNLGRDHLDYHPTVEAYLEAKLQLFKRLLKPGQPAIINVDGPMWAEAAAAAIARGCLVREVGGAGRFITLIAAERDGFGQRLRLAHAGQTYDVMLNLIGTYQATNALVAAAFALEAGAAPADVFATLPLLRTVNGRLDVAGKANGGIAVVDYAHKPEALAAALDALRPFATGKLICVFGCGGNRDKGKRPIMGEIAARRADVVIVTDDNPRNEIAALVRNEVLAGMRGVSGTSVEEIGDRAKAIQRGVALLGPGDVLLVAGKGHETGQIVGPVTLPFSDHETIASAIKDLNA